METSHPVLSGLIRKRAELSGEAEALTVRLMAINANVIHLDAVIGLFDPAFNLASIRPKRARGPNVAKPGEMSRFVLDALRGAAEPIGTPELTVQLMAARGLDAQDRVAYRNMGKRVCMALRHQEGRGAVRSAHGPGRIALWSIAG